MRLQRRALVTTLGLLAACSARHPASVERSPASTLVPIGPERSSTSSSGVPIGPERGVASRGGHGAPVGPERGAAEGDTRNDERNEGVRQGCGAASMLRIDMGQGFSAHDILTRLTSDGTFSGRVRIPTWRNVPLQGGASYWVVDYANAVEYDRRVLAPWFDGSAADVKGSDVYEAVRDSEAFGHATGFANGNGVVSVYRDEYDIGHRMASLLAVMFAAAKQGDPDCVEYINREWVSKILPSTEAQKLMNQIRSKEASLLVKEGRIGQVFGEVAANRQRLHDDLKTLDETILNKEEQNKSALEQIQFQLKDSYFSLKSELMEIAPCRDFVSLQETLTASHSDPKIFANKLVSDCKTRLNSQLSDARSESLRLQGDIKVFEARRASAEEAMKKAEDQGRSGEVERRAEVIARYDQEIENKRTRFDAVSERAQKFSDYLAYLVNAETGSVTMELKRINDLLAERQKRITSEYLKPELQQIERVKGDLKSNSTHYLTLGFFGGFDASSGDLSR